MIEFVVIFLVVLSCTGGLFIVLYFSPKALPIVNGCWSRLRTLFADWVSRLRALFADWVSRLRALFADWSSKLRVFFTDWVSKLRVFVADWVSRLRAFVADCGSRLDAFVADWRASANRKREQFQLDGKRRWLEKDRLYREQSHLLPGWDWNGLVVSVCCFLVGLFCWWFGRSTFYGLRDHYDRVGDIGIEDPEGFYHTLKGANLFWDFGGWIVFLSFPCVLVSGFVFCRRFFSAEARYRRIVDREEGLKAERRRRQEGGQDD